MGGDIKEITPKLKRNEFGFKNNFRGFVPLLISISKIIKYSCIPHSVYYCREDNYTYIDNPCVTYLNLHKHASRFTCLEMEVGM